MNYKENLLHSIDSNPLWDLLEKNYYKHFVNRENIIPKKIHQVWLGGPLPEKYKSLIKVWKAFHPEWEYKLWTDDDIDSFGMTNIEMFNAMSNLGAKADIFRYEIIYRNGGLYADTDFICHKSFNDLLHLDFFSGGGPARHPHTFNGLFAARIGHPILKNIIDALGQKKRESENDFTKIMAVTGPDFFSNVVLDYMATASEKIVIFPEAFFYPFPAELRFDNNIRTCSNLEKAHSSARESTYAIHLWHTAWQEQLNTKRPVAVNTKWHLKVPKILHLYFGGEKMPYIRYMTIKSFMDQNPDWKVMFWYPKHLFIKLTWDSFELKYKVDCDDYLPQLMKLPIITTAIDFKDFNFKNNVPENFKSDFIRDHLLNICGGVWSDTDILYFNPMNALSVNKPENKNIETFVCLSEYGHSNGFLMAAQGSKFFEKMSSISAKEYDGNQYQCIGPTMYNKYYPTLESIDRFSPAVNIPMDAVYAHNASQIGELVNGTLPRFTASSVGCHWYAGHPLWAKFFKETNGGMRNLPNNIIGNLLKNASEK